MTTSQERFTADWWAEGDTPVHTDSHVTYLIDGRIAMHTMCRHFLLARTYIYLANWGMTPGLELVRGPDHRAGPDGSPAQQQLIAALRSYGLGEAEIAFWTTHDLSVQAVLGYAVSRGIEVKVLLWDCLQLPYLSHYSPSEAQKDLEQVGVTCLLDDSARGLLHHPAESLHQKISVVDGTHAFVGGVDLLIEPRGEFDRWDTHSHPFATPLRRTQDGGSPHPWHDAHALIEGPAAGDVELNFRQRWNDVVHRHLGNSIGSAFQSNNITTDSLSVPEHSPAPPMQSQSIVQIARTIPAHTYSFGPDKGIQGIAQIYSKALGNVQNFLYLENQYLWLHTFIGIDLPFVGGDNPEMENNIRKMGEALQRGAIMAIVLPDHPNAGRAFSDAGLLRLYEEAPQAVAAGRVHAFSLATSSTRQDDGKEHYRPIYVHAKVAIIDDLWATVGSGNLNNRGMRDDTEMNVATLDPHLARDLRLMLWAEHLGLVSDDDLCDLARYLGHQLQLPEENERGARVWQYVQETLGDPQEGMRLMAERAQDNLRRYKENLPLLGHLLPYLRAEEAQQQGLNFREEHGWIEEQ